MAYLEHFITVLSLSSIIICVCSNRDNLSDTRSNFSNQSNVVKVINIDREVEIKGNLHSRNDTYQKVNEPDKVTHCNIHVELEKSFVKDIGEGSIEKAERIVRDLIQMVNLHFRQLKFINDDKPDNIGFLMTSITSNVSDMTGDAWDYMRNMSLKDHDDHCLAIYFTTIPLYLGSIIQDLRGVAWIGDSNSRRKGGICDKQNPFSYNKLAMTFADWDMLENSVNIKSDAYILFRLLLTSFGGIDLDERMWRSIGEVLKENKQIIIW